MVRDKLKTLIGVLIILSTVFLFSSCNEARRTENTLIVGWATPVHSLNPILTPSITWPDGLWSAIDMIYDTLIMYDTDLNPIPGLAKSWYVEDDGITWILRLQEGVKWHDGMPFSAEDVKFTLDFIKQEGLNTFDMYIKYIEQVEIIDDFTVKIVTAVPISNMENNLMWIPILPQHIWRNIDFKEIKNLNIQNPVGTGAFKLKEMKKGEFIIFEANKEYYKGSPKVDFVIFKFYSNDDAVIRALKRKEIDFATRVPPAMISYLKEEKDIEIDVAKSFNLIYVMINSYKNGKQHPALMDIRVRKAIAHGIDKDGIIDIILNGYADKADSIIPPFSEWHNKNLKKYDFNLDKAARILDEAGYVDKNGDGIREGADGLPLDFRLYVAKDICPGITRISEMIKKDLRKIGIKVEPTAMTGNAMSGVVLSDYDFDLAIWHWWQDPDPSFILSVLTSEQIHIWNDCGYMSPDYDSLFLKQYVELDKELRKETVFRMQEIINDDLPYIVLFYRRIARAYRTDMFEGFTPMTEGVINYTLTFKNMRRK